MFRQLLIILVTAVALTSAEGGRGGRGGRGGLRYAGAPEPVSQQIAQETCTGLQKRGTRFYDGCNWCRCTDQPGLAFCHRRGCPDLTAANVGARITERTCVGASSASRQFYDGCNWCTCGVSAVDVVCTMRMCDLKIGA